MAVFISTSQLPESWRPQAQAAVAQWRAHVLSTASQRRRGDRKRNINDGEARPTPSWHVSPAPTPARRRPAARPPAPSWKL